MGTGIFHLHATGMATKLTHLSAQPGEMLKLIAVILRAFCYLILGVGCGE